MFSLKKLVIFLFCIFFNISICISAQLKIDQFSGTWCSVENNEKEAFTLIINRVLNIYKGSYFAVALAGNRIDDNEEAFSFNVTNKNTIRTKIKAGISGKIGLVQLKVIDKNNLEWTMIKSPTGDFYVPRKTMLNKCDG